MKTTTEIRKYIEDWLVGLNIGPVYQDSRTVDDTTKTRNRRTYVVYYFENGIDDIDCWFVGQCTVWIGCRDKEPGKADLKTLKEATNKFVDKFEVNDDANGINLMDCQEVDYRYDNIGNHECQYVFDVQAWKD